MTSRYPTQDEIDAARRRLGLAEPRVDQQQQPVGFQRPLREPTPLPEPAGRPSRGGVGGFLGRLVTPLVDLPEQTNPILRAGELGFESLTSPAGLLSAALIPVTGGASLGFAGAAGVAARFATRAAAEAAVGGAAGVVAEKTAGILEQAPGIIKVPGALAAGALAGIATARGIRGLTGEAARSAALKAAAVAEQSTEAFTPASNKLIDLRRQARAKLDDPAVRRELKGARSAEIGRRLAAGRENIAQARAAGRALSTQEEELIALSAQSGKQPRIVLPELHATPELVTVLHGEIWNSPALSALDAFGAERALRELLSGGVPGNYELSLLERVWGPAFSEAVRATQPYSIGRFLTDLINLPRAVVASMDLSWPGNQGIFVAPLAPVEWFKSVRSSARAFADPEYAKSVDDLVRGRGGTETQKAVSALLQKGGVQFTGSAARPEELFAASDKVMRAAFGGSEFGRGLAASERGFVTAGNSMRFSLGEKYLLKMAELTAKEGDDSITALGRIPFSDVRRLSDAINVLTGRSTWEVFERKEGWSAALNAAFFAPNFFASRLQMPLMLAENIVRRVREAGPGILADPVALYRGDPVLALQMRALGSFVAAAGAGLGAIAAAKKAGLLPDVTVETDPRSTSFGKIRVGSAAIDFWGGYSQIAGAVARTLYGQQKTQRGNIISVDRPEVVWDRFVRSKVSPAVGLAWNAHTGSSYIGERVTGDPDDLERQVMNALMPLAWRDIADGYREAGLSGALTSAPAIIGGRVTNFQSLGFIRDDVARQRFEKPYGDLLAWQRDEVNNHSRVIDKQAEVDQTMGDSFGAAIDTITSERLRAENVSAARYLAGQDDIRAFADNVEEQQRVAATRRESAVAQFNIQEMPSNSPLQQALQEWRALYRKADIGYEQGVETGRIDWDRHAQMERALLARLTPEQREFIEGRVRAGHDPSTQWYFDNKQYISESGYYDAADAEFARVSARLAPQGIGSYSALVAAVGFAEMRGEIGEARRLASILRPVDARIEKARERMRRANPALDAALVVNRGYTPKSARTRELLRRGAG